MLTTIIEIFGLCTQPQPKNEWVISTLYRSAIVHPVHAIIWIIFCGLSVGSIILYDRIHANGWTPANVQRLEDIRAISVPFFMLWVLLNVYEDE
jgi:hypothetical protein